MLFYFIIFLIGLGQLSPQVAAVYTKVIALTKKYFLCE